MIRGILQAKVLNPFRSQVPKGFYSRLKGHTGVDLDFKVGDTLLSPVTGKVLKVVIQKEMGKCLYLLHEATGDIWVFAHNTTFLHKAGDTVKRMEELVVTGNTGSKTTAPHSHIEVITPKPIIDASEGGSIVNKLMTRSLAGYVGYNVDPIKRLLALYAKYNIDPKTGIQSVK